MEDLPLTPRPYSPSTTTTPHAWQPAVDAHSAQFLSLLTRTAASHARQQGLTAVLQDAQALSEGLLRYYLDSGLGSALEASRDALCEFDQRPDTHIARVQHCSRAVGTDEGVCVPLARQLYFREMMARLTTLASLLMSNVTSSVSWAQSPCLKKEDLEVVASRLRKCLAVFTRFSKLAPAAAK